MTNTNADTMIMAERIDVVMTFFIKAKAYLLIYQWFTNTCCHLINIRIS